MQYQTVNPICYAFYCTIKKWWKFSQKTDVLAHFQGFLVYTVLRSVSYAPIFGQIKGIIKIDNRGKFHQYSICGYEVIYLERYL